MSVWDPPSEQTWAIHSIIQHFREDGLLNHIQLEFHEELPSNYVSGSKSNEFRKDEEGEFGFKASCMQLWENKPA